jgi:hypothetical protein
MRQYVVTLHAEEEMDNDGLSIFDIEHGILTGKIFERQKDIITAEWKYKKKYKVNRLKIAILIYSWNLKNR